MRVTGTVEVALGRCSVLVWFPLAPFFACVVCEDVKSVDHFGLHLIIFLGVQLLYSLSAFFISHLLLPLPVFMFSFCFGQAPTPHHPLVACSLSLLIFHKKVDYIWVNLLQQQQRQVQ